MEVAHSGKPTHMLHKSAVITYTVIVEALYEQTCGPEVWFIIDPWLVCCITGSCWLYDREMATFRQEVLGILGDDKSAYFSTESKLYSLKQ